MSSAGLCLVCSSPLTLKFTQHATEGFCLLRIANTESETRLDSSGNSMRRKFKEEMPKKGDLVQEDRGLFTWLSFIV